MRVRIQLHTVFLMTLFVGVYDDGPCVCVLCVCIHRSTGLLFESLSGWTETRSLPVVTEIEPNVAPRIVKMDECATV